MRSADKLIYLAAFEEETDPPDWSASALSDQEEALAASGLSFETLVVAPLSAGWTKPLPPTWYRSGAGPLEALRDAARAILEGQVEAVVIRGAEPLRTGYSREERHLLMAIYGGTTIPEAYDSLARAFCRRKGWSEDDFLGIAQALYGNYLATASLCDPRLGEAADEKWLCRITPLQRGVDCANPLIDWRGQLLVLSARAAQALQTAGGEMVELAGVGFERLLVDGPAHVEEISRFAHLEKAVCQAEAEAGLTLAALAGDPQAAFEVYSCYPVIPAAFLAASRIAEKPAAMAAFLAERPITVTGGMNLARAPWNQPALRALIRVGAAMARGERTFGVVHGNGGIGYAQGVAILKAS